MSAKAAAKAATKQAKKLRQKAKRTPIIAQQATHTLESLQLMSNVASEANAASPTAAATQDLSQQDLPKQLPYHLPQHLLLNKMCLQEPSRALLLFQNAPSLPSRMQLMQQ